jgi:hypothetical protein
MQIEHLYSLADEKSILFHALNHVLFAFENKRMNSGSSGTHGPPRTIDRLIIFLSLTYM